MRILYSSNYLSIFVLFVSLLKCLPRNILETYKKMNTIYQAALGSSETLPYVTKNTDSICKAEF